MHDRTARDWARAGARQLVEVARGGDTGSVFEALRQLAEEQADGGPGLRLVVGELISAAAGMMLARAGGRAEEALYAVDLSDDDDGEVQIDELAPSLRATVRALLAELNGHPEDARFQLELALRDDITATLEVVVHALLWTIGMLDWCAAEGFDVPEWLCADLGRRAS